MTNPPHPEVAVLNAALELHPAERAAYLDQACAGDAALRRQVEALLQAHEQAEDFLKAPPAGFDLNRTVRLNVPLTEKPGDRIGRYKLLQQIGEGGCGVVYMAEQEEPVRRRVALKVIKLGMDTKQVIARFEAERQALAIMNHPNIAKVLDAGASDTGRPYFVMELVRGIKITDFCDQKNLSTRDRLDLFIQVCRAVQHAHQKGIIHRDLKPSNILVTSDDGVPVPKVIDFGIAKATQGRLTDHTVFTAFEQFIGTPAYMSPEQAEMSLHDIDTRTDIYSLGVLLYELLTGQTPFDAKELLAAGLDAMRKTIREVEPVKPSTRLTQARLANLSPDSAPSAPRNPQSAIADDLDWIVMKALEKDRTRRYETVNGLAADLTRHLNDEPVVARPPSRIYEFQKTVRRHKFGFAAAAAILLVLAGGITLTTWQAVRATRAERQQSVLRAEAEKARQNEAGLRQTAQTEANRAEAAATDLKLTLSTSDFLQSARFIAEDNANDALPFLARSLSLNPVNDAALTRLTTLLTYHSWMVPTLRFKHGGPVNSAEFSLDGKRIVTASADGTACVWDARTGQPLVEPMQCSFSVTSAEFSPDGKRIVTGSQFGTTRVWDAQTGQPLTEPMKHGKETITYVSSVHFSPDGKRIVTGSSDNTARVWDAETGQPLTEPLVQGLDLKEKEKKEREEREKAKPKGNSTVYSINTVGYVNSADGLTVTGEVSTTPVTAQFSSDGERIVTASEDRTARVWDAQTGRPLTELMKHGSGVRAAQFSPDGKRIVTVARDGTARVWDAQTGQSLTEPMKHGSGVASAEFSADGKRIVTAAYDNTARVWNAQTGQLLEDPALHGRLPGFKQFSPDGKRMVSSSSGRIARVWDAQTGRPLTEPMKHGGSVSTAQFSPDGKRILTASGDHAAYVWEARTGPPLSLRPPLDLINSRRSDAEGAQPQFSHDGRRIVMPSADKTARVWDAQTGEPLTRISHDSEVVSAQFSPDDQRIVTTSEDKTARLWDAQTGQPVTEPMKHEGELYSAEFAPDGKRIATGSVENTRKSGLDLHAPRFSPDGKRLVAAWGVNRLWDVQTGQPLTEPIKGVGKPPQFNPNTPWGIAGVLDTQTGQPLIKPMMHGGQVNSAQFSSDGKRIVTASADKTARVWDAQTGQPLTEPMIHGGDVRTAQFSPDGKRIVTASYYGDATARVWDAQTGQPLTEPISPGGHVFSVQFSPDGKRIVTASEGTARVWDAQTGQPLTEPMTHGDKPFSREGFPIVEPFSAQFSPDGKRIVTATTSPLDRKAHVWDVAPTQAGCPDWLLQLAEAISGKVLSKEGVLEPTRLNRVETLKQIRQKLAAQPEDDWVVWGRWLLADRTTRTISPFAKLTVPEQVNRNIQENTLASLQEATRLSPTNSLAFARLALVVKDQDPTKNPARLDNAEFYARFAMRLEPDNSAAWQSLGAVQSLQHQPEALETIDRALELQPGNAQAWEVRGEILENTNRLADALAAYNRQVELLPADTNQETRGALLNRARVLRQLGRWEEAGQDVGLACDIPRREARDLPNLIDLSAFYNAGFKGNWHGDRVDNDLSALPVGIQAMAGTQFDVRGLIQLCGDRPATSRVPEQIAGVPTLRKCGRVHFLHGVIRGYNPTNTVIGKYVFHYADGTSQERLLVLGKDVLDWWTLPPESTANDGLIVAWIGKNGKSRDQGGTGTIQLYKTSWENPSPQVELTGIDFISAKEISAPFLVAITVE